MKGPVAIFSMLRILLAGLSLPVAAADGMAAVTLSDVGLFSDLTRPLSAGLQITLLVCGLLALVECFFGYLLLRIQIAFMGFLAGASLGILLARGITGGALEGWILLWYPVLLLLFGVLGGMIAFKIYRFGLFCVGFLLTLLVTFLLSTNVALAVVLGVIVGLIVALLIRPAVILTTAVSGGIMAGCYLLFAIGVRIPWPRLLLGLLLALLGLLVQTRMTRHTSRGAKGKAL